MEHSGLDLSKISIDALTDPKIFGPGMWMTIHILAIHAKRPQEMLRFIQVVEKLINNLQCKHCQTHALVYMHKHPMVDYMHYTNKKQIPIGMFVWSVEFHNTVNKFLDKPVMDWQVAYVLYSTELPCGENCATEDETERIEEKISNERVPVPERKSNKRGLIRYRKRPETSNISGNMLDMHNPQVIPVGNKNSRIEKSEIIHTKSAHVNFSSR